MQFVSSKRARVQRKGRCAAIMSRVSIQMTALALTPAELSPWLASGTSRPRLKFVSGGLFLQKDPEPGKRTLGKSSILDEPATSAYAKDDRG